MSVKKWIVRLALALVAPLAFVGVLEIAVVLVGFEYPADASPIALPLPEGEVDGRSLHARDACELWKPVPGALVPWGRDAINAAGFRGPELAREKTPGVLRVATLGDSSTFGYGVRYEECWTAQLAQRLAERGVPAECLDAGVIGSTVRQGLERYARDVRAFRPDVVVAAFGATNEHAASMQQSDGVLIASLAFETHAWGRFTERLRAQCKLAHVVAWWIDEARGGRSEIQRRARERRSWIGHNLKNIGDPQWEGERRVSVGEFESCLRELERRVSNDGARLVLLAPPRQTAAVREKPVLQLYTDKTLAVARAEKLSVVDGRTALAAEGAEYDALFLDYYHPTVEGHRRLSQAIAEAVVESASALPR